jgi:hypothetical protein
VKSPISKPPLAIPQAPPLSRATDEEALPNRLARLSKLARPVIKEKRIQDVKENIELLLAWLGQLAMRRFQLAIAKASVFLLEAAILSKHPNFQKLAIFFQFFMQQTQQFFIKST